MPGPDLVQESKAPLLNGRHLTLLGRSAVLILVVILANAICWVLAGVSFDFINLAFLAWVCLRWECQFAQV
jgi:hypothetical protein